MIGKILREIIKKEKFSYRKVAKDLGIDHASLYRSLKTGGNPEWNTIEKILSYLGYDFKILKRKEVKPKRTKPSASRRRKGDI